MGDLHSLDDETLLASLEHLASREREDTADVVEHLAEVDRRSLALDRAYPSLFVYCVEKLGYSRAAAYFRIRAARALRRHPEILPLLRSGDVHLEAVVRLHPYLDDPQAQGLLEEAKGKSRQEVEAMVARFSPQPPPKESVRFISVRREPPADLAQTEPLLAPFHPQPTRDETPPPESRVHLSFSAPVAFMTLLERARELCRHKFPEGRLEDILAASLDALLEKKDPDRRLLAGLPRLRRRGYSPKPGKGAQEQTKLRSP